MRASTADCFLVFAYLFAAAECRGTELIWGYTRREAIHNRYFLHKEELILTIKKPLEIYNIIQKKFRIILLFIINAINYAAIIIYEYIYPKLNLLKILRDRLREFIKWRNRGYPFSNWNVRNLLRMDAEKPK